MAKGASAFLATFRPRDGITAADAEKILRYLKVVSKWLYVVQEKKGKDAHLHACIFTQKEYQRSNLITNITKNCINHWDEDEKRNFRRWNKDRHTGAFKTMTSNHVIQGYLDGTYARKINDYFEVVYDNLPEDLALLEDHYPDVGALQRPKNQKYHTLLRQLQARFAIDDRKQTLTEAHERMTIMRLCEMIRTLENEDIREIMADPRIFKQTADAFYRWYYNISDRDYWDGVCVICRKNPAWRFHPSVFGGPGGEGKWLLSTVCVACKNSTKLPG